MKYVVFHQVLRFPALVILILAACLSDAEERLNVLFIPVDDLKPMLGCYGDDEIVTPNIDRLAEKGSVFLNNACQQAVCGPSRASIMTGLYPDQTGVWDLVTKMREVNPGILTLPQYFKQHGYLTAGVGKTFDPRCVDSMEEHDAPSWTIPYNSEKLIRSRDHYQDYVNPETVASARVIEEQLAGKSFSPPWLKDRAIAELGTSITRPATECMEVPDDAYPDGALADAAIRLLNRIHMEGKPFFLSVGFTKPHLPFAAPKKYWDLYDRDTVKLAPFQGFSKNGPQIAYKGLGELGQYSDMPRKGVVSSETQKRLKHGYMAAVTYVDAQIGKVIDHLDTLGLSENTIVCLWGDHGWHLGDHGLWCKHTNFEQAVRSPLIIKAPGSYKSNATRSPTELVDVFPTLCELSGLDIPEQIDGKSLVPLMKDPTASVRPDAMAQYPRSPEGIGDCMGYTLRDERFRYVKWLKMNYKAGDRTGDVVATELYDYTNDPHETINLAAEPEYQDVVEKFEESFRMRNIAQES